MKLAIVSGLLAGATAQNIGKARAEKHLKMPIQQCTTSGGCVFQNTESVLDANWRWLHAQGCTNSSKCNCYLGNVWENATCSSVSDCTAK